MCPHFDLLHAGALKSEVKAVVGEGANLLTVTIITQTDDWDPTLLDETNQLLQKQKETYFTASLINFWPLVNKVSSIWPMHDVYS